MLAHRAPILAVVTIIPDCRALSNFIGRMAALETPNTYLSTLLSFPTTTNNRLFSGLRAITMLTPSGLAGISAFVPFIRTWDNPAMEVLR
ncbi:hypothetical protein DFH09DRAFT_1335630 [Mycena vulgaris]|nr:hypothetical protein DFH09DRAFT_1335630 [Mycena vulgaris]